MSRDHRLRSWAVHCTGTKKNGEPCGGFAIRGGTVCNKHGGQLPVVKLAASARIRRLLEPAIDVIAAALVMNGVPDKTQMQAARMVLRMNGISDTMPSRRAAHFAQKEIASTPIEEVDDEIAELIASVSKPLELGAGSAEDLEL